MSRNNCLRQLFERDCLIDAETEPALTSKWLGKLLRFRECMMRAVLYQRMELLPVSSNVFHVKADVAADLFARVEDAFGVKDGFSLDE